MSYRWAPHTAEVQLEIDAGTEAAVFADAMRALAELLGGAPTASAGESPTNDKEHVRREVRLGADEPAALLVAWLEELVFLAETEDLVPEQTERIELSDGCLVATVRCRRGNPRHVVKGATYHRLAFERGPHGFRATVVLDV